VIEIRYTDEAERRVTFVLVPPGERGANAGTHPTLFETTQFRVSVLIDSGVDTVQVLELVSWAEGLLTSSDAVSVTQAMDVKRLAIGLMDPLRLRKGRERVARMAQRIQAKNQFGDWTVAGTKALAAGGGAELELRGPNGAELTFAMEIQPLPDAPLVGVRYHLHGKTDTDDARRVVTEVMTAMRG